MNFIEDYSPNKENVLSMQRITEAFKLASDQRSKLGDDRFVESVSHVVRNLTG